MFRGLVPTIRSFDEHIRICRDLLFYYDDRPGFSSAFVVVSGGYAGLWAVCCGLWGCVYVPAGCVLRCRFRVWVRVVWCFVLRRSFFFVCVLFVCCCSGFNQLYIP